MAAALPNAARECRAEIGTRQSAISPDRNRVLTPRNRFRTDSMTDRRAEVYGKWAADEGRLQDFVSACTALYEKLPGVGWP